MHELGMIQGAVKHVLEKMEDMGAYSVSRVDLVLSAGDEMTEKVVRQYFGMLTKGTPAESAELIIGWIPVNYQCVICGNQFRSALPSDKVDCPVCNSLVLALEHSHECYVSAIMVNFEPAVAELSF